jgi:hypothetical protein
MHSTAPTTSSRSLGFYFIYEFKLIFPTYVTSKIGPDMGRLCTTWNYLYTSKGLKG